MKRKYIVTYVAEASYEVIADSMVDAKAKASELHNPYVFKTKAVIAFPKADEFKKYVKMKN